MKTILAITVLVFVTNAHGYGAGQVMQTLTASKLTNVKAPTKRCQDCLNFFNDLKQMVDSKTSETQIEELLDQMICSQMGSLEGMCKNLIAQYVPKFLKYLSSLEDPNQVCGVLGMCTQEALRLFSQRVALPKDEGCDLCKDAVNELKDLDRNKEAQDAVKGFIEDQLCARLGSLASECKQEVETYATLVFQLLENELDPVTICQDLGLCTQMKEMPLSRIGLLSSHTNVKVIKKDNVKAGPECVLCEFVMTELEKILEDNETETSIMAALDKVCDLMPKTVGNKCVSFVSSYGPEIIALLLKEVAPSKVCTALNFCPAVAVQKGAAICILCEFVMNKVDTLIGSNKSEASIEAALEKVCALMPSTIRAECKDFVVVHGKDIIDLLVKKLSPLLVCQKLGLCTSDKAVKVLKVSLSRHTKITASTECVMCEYAMKELVKMLADNKTEAGIVAALDKVCSILPRTVTAECRNFINTYGPAIIVVFLQEMDPNVACTFLGLCSTPTNVAKATPLKVGSEKCVFCKIIMNSVLVLLKENGTEQKVEDVLDKVCNDLSDQMKMQCIEFVKEYAPLVVDIITDDFDAEQICEDIGLCNTTRKAMELKDNRLYFKGDLVGRNKCTYGPSYWCINKENAIRCRTVKHCQKHVWNKV